MMKLVVRVGETSINVKTEGLISDSLPEIEVSVATSDLIEPAKLFLVYVAEYLLTGRRPLKPGETMPYGYWLTRFEKSDAGEGLEVWEYNAEGLQFVKGASLTLTYWRDQHAICRAYAAEFQPPRPDTLTVISDGVLEGHTVQGVRHLSPGGMSGWWITTDLFNGDVSTLKSEHTYHVTARRPDLAKFMALPPGFRYDLAAHEDVWFDGDILAVP
jgi:hypothetical protein